MFINMRFYFVLSYVILKIYSGYFEYIKNLYCEELWVSGLFKNGKKNFLLKGLLF